MHTLPTRDLIMTHMPPQFRQAAVLVDEWRRRADEHRVDNAAVADVYDRCASELLELDVHTEGAPAGAEWRRSRRNQELIRQTAVGLVTAGAMAALVSAARRWR